MACIMCLHLGITEKPFIQWCCKKKNKVVTDIYSFPEWCPTNEKDVIDNG